jgi:hypothetical protein
MSNGWKDDYKAAVVGGLSALCGFVTLVGTFFYIIRAGGVVDRWQALGMLAVALVIAFAVAAMLRFALAPLIAPKSSSAVTDADAATRGRIAPLVLLIGSIAIVALAAALIFSFVVLAYQPAFQTVLAPKIDTLLTGVFGTVLPVVATWVGTVLAFYFGSENFRQAAQSTREALSDRLAPRKKITDVMVPYERTGRLGAENEADAESTLTMLDVIHTLSAAATRVIVFNLKAQAPIYIIRSSSPPMPANWVTPEYAAGTALPKDVKLKDYLDINDNRADARKFRFIDENATPEAALALMTDQGVDDLFITKDGQKTSRVLGWVTSHDLLKK